MAESAMWPGLPTDSYELPQVGHRSLGISSCQSVRYVAEAGIIETKKIDGDDNPSDLFTKALGLVKFRKFGAILEQGQPTTWLREITSYVASNVAGIAW